MANTPSTVLLVGGGVRGQNYTSYALAHPDRLKVIGIAEPRDFQRNHIKRLHSIKDENVFKDWTEMASRDKFADGVIIATLSTMHKAPAIAFARMGYHIMLESPMSTTEEDCQELVRVCKEAQVITCVCHVLRYSPPARKIRELIESGAIGDLVNIQHMEQYGVDYSSHASVRGNYRREDISGSFLLGKSIHDIDLISYWVGETNEACVSAFGNLSHFTKENKPEKASDLCVNCPVERECPYSAQKIYLEPFNKGFRGFPVDAMTDVLDIEHVTAAVHSYPWGKCVYDFDNNVPTHYVISLQFDGGVTATHTVSAFTEANGTRETRIHGTMGELYCKFGGPVEYFDFRTMKTTVYNMDPPGPDVPPPLKHYWGSDYNTVDSFARALQEKDETIIQSGAEQSLSSYRLTFAADRAMKEKTLITVN